MSTWHIPWKSIALVRWVVAASAAYARVVAAEQGEQWASLTTRPNKRHKIWKLLSRLLRQAIILKQLFQIEWWTLFSERKKRYKQKALDLDFATRVYEMALRDGCQHIVPKVSTVSLWVIGFEIITSQSNRGLYNVWISTKTASLVSQPLNKWLVAFNRYVTRCRYKPQVTKELTILLTELSDRMFSVELIVRRTF